MAPTMIAITPAEWLHAPAAAAFERMVEDGCPRDDSITEAGRTGTRQRQLWDMYLAGYLVATAAYPGTSKHETGRAMDVNGPTRAWIRAHGAAYGWMCDRVRNEPWHMEYELDRDTHLGRVTPPDPLTEEDMPLTEQDYDEIARRVWAYSNPGHGSEDAWSRLRSVEARTERYLDHKVSEVVTKIPALVWGFKRGADGKIRGADRIDVVQMLADVLTKITGKAPDRIKHPATRSTPTDL